MSLIQSLLPLLKNGSSVNFNLKEVNGQIQVLIEPSLSNVEVDTTDSVVATLQAALLHPVRIMCNRDATDAEVIAALGVIGPSHEGTNDQLAEYRQRIADAAAEAKRLEAEKAAAKPAKGAVKNGKAKPAKGGLSAPADESDDEESADDDSSGTEEGGTDGASTEAGAADSSPAKTKFDLF